MSKIVLAGIVAILILSAFQLYRFGMWQRVAPPSDRAQSPDLHFRPEDGPIHIIALGTSLTARSAWPAILASKLNACRSISTVTLEILAKPGASSDWGVKTLRERLADSGKMRPNLLLIEFATNDASLIRGIPLRKAMLNNLAFQQVAQRAKIPAFLMIMNPVHGISRWARPALNNYNQAYRRQADSNTFGRLGLIDLSSVWKQLDKSAKTILIPDSLHPATEASATITAPAIYLALQHMLCDQATTKATANKFGPLGNVGKSR